MNNKCICIKTWSNKYIKGETYIFTPVQEGIIFLPYNIVDSIPITETPNFSPKKLIKSRYSIATNSDNYETTPMVNTEEPKLTIVGYNVYYSAMSWHYFNIGEEFDNIFTTLKELRKEKLEKLR